MLEQDARLHGAKTSAVVPHGGARRGTLLGILVSLVGSLMLVAFAAWQPWQPAGTLFLDLATVAQVSPLVGSISYLCDTIWFASGFICLFVAICAPASRAFMLSSALVTFALAADDMFLLHDYFFPRFLGSEEWPMKLVHASAAVVYFVVFMRHIRQAGLPLFIFANMFLVLSLAMDNQLISQLINQVYPLLGTPQVLAEDGAKTIGILAWSCFMTLAAYQVIKNLRAGAG